MWATKVGLKATAVAVLAVATSSLTAGPTFRTVSAEAPTQATVPSGAVGDGVALLAGPG